MNKKYAPVLVLVAILILVVGIVFAVRSRSTSDTEMEEENIPELAEHQRPFTTLTPTEDGHYLVLAVNDIDVPGASMMEYEIFYETAEGINQGVPGRVTLTGPQSVEREILLGSESSGKFRYDEGVDDGTLTLKFRDVDGKFIGKVKTTWRLYQGTQDLSSDDGALTYSLDDVSESYFVVMNTFGLPASFDGLTTGPYGVFASDEEDHPGTLNSPFARFEDGQWSDVASSFDNIGIFAK